MAKIDPAILSSAGEALMAGNVTAAILACKSDKKEPFSSNEEIDARIIELILTRTPKALADCRPQCLPSLRVAAALMLLSGEGASSIRRFLGSSDEWDYDYRLEPKDVVLMLHAYGHHLESLRRMAEVGITNVMCTSSKLSDECPVCRKADGKVFPIAEAPEVPLPDCTCPRACSCIVVATS